MPKDAFAAFDDEPDIGGGNSYVPTERIVVPNSFPTIPPSTYRLAIIGEAPGADEEIQGKPFQFSH